ncbi:MAG: prepilin-type N-terminal cleavage/methylation domain-containing protein [Candidatus Omnitrophota bacterium]
MKQTAYTLIELLIVILIVGILATIAIPLLQGSLMRARVAASMANIKTLATAVDCLRADTGCLLVDTKGGYDKWGYVRIVTVFNSVGIGSDYGNGGPDRHMREVYAPLTSPAAYLSQIPKDPFIPPAHIVDYNANPSRFQHKDEYSYYACDPKDTWEECFCNEISRGEYWIRGCGPINASNGYYIGSPPQYHCSNGIVSNGGILYSSKDGFYTRGY